MTANWTAFCRSSKTRTTRLVWLSRVRNYWNNNSAAPKVQRYWPMIRFITIHYARICVCKHALKRVFPRSNNKCLLLRAFVKITNFTKRTLAFVWRKKNRFLISTRLNLYDIITLYVYDDMPCIHNLGLPTILGSESYLLCSGYWKM